MYRCADGCSFTRDADTDKLLMVGVWQFVPAGDPVAIGDPDYHVYGAWLKKPDSVVGTGYSAGLGTGSDLFDAVTPDPGADEAAVNTANMANGISALTGKATYQGSAAGFFAERHVNAEGAQSGMFTATAELTANFDGGDDIEDSGPDDTVDTDDGAGMISGMIKNFVRDDGETVDWVVELKAINLGAMMLTPETDDADDAMVAVQPSAMNDAGGFAAGHSAGHASGVPLAGEWGVQFTGNGADATQHPGGVAGTFGAQRGSPTLLTTDVAKGEVPDAGFVGVIGGFGARKE
jgi:hypothetical protein